MYYRKTITVLRNTLVTVPQKAYIHLALGTIQSIEAGFPSGCACLVHLAVRHRGSNVLPWSRDEYLAWDGHVFTIPCVYPIDAAPYDLEVVTWSEDDSYDHTITVGVDFREGIVDSELVTFFQQLRTFAEAQR